MDWPYGNADHAPSKSVCSPVHQLILPGVLFKMTQHCVGDNIVPCCIWMSVYFVEETLACSCPLLKWGCQVKNVYSPLSQCRRKGLNGLRCGLIHDWQIDLFFRGEKKNEQVRVMLFRESPCTLDCLEDKLEVRVAGDCVKRGPCNNVRGKAKAATIGKGKGLPFKFLGGADEFPGFLQIDNQIAAFNDAPKAFP